MSPHSNPNSRKPEVLQGSTTLNCHFPSKVYISYPITIHPGEQQVYIGKYFTVLSFEQTQNLLLTDQRTRLAGHVFRLT